MRLDQVNLGSAETLSYLERYVNDGSPSGFTDRYTTSITTCPLSAAPNFKLVSVAIPNFSISIEHGTRPLGLEKFGYLLHPDMMEHASFKRCHLSIGPTVTPTSSARTVRMIDSDPMYIKLSYDGLIGRVNRRMIHSQALSAIEVSRVISNGIEAGTLLPSFRFMREIYSQTLRLGTDCMAPLEWSFVVRESDPYPRLKPGQFLIPAFALFSRDQRAPDDPLIIDQLVQRSGLSAHDFVVDGLLEPLIKGHFNALVKCGLQLELHSQNVLFCFDRDWRPIGFTCRDAESIDKDLSLMEQLRIPNRFKSIDYKCLRSTDYNYQIMHSFMFDFKLGEYLIEPLCKWLAKSTGEMNSIYNEIRAITNQQLTELPEDFMPSGVWYSYGNIVHDQTRQRPYIVQNNPKFR